MHLSNIIKASKKEWNQLLLALYLCKSADAISFYEKEYAVVEGPNSKFQLLWSCGGVD